MMWPEVTEVNRLRWRDRQRNGGPSGTSFASG